MLRKQKLLCVSYTQPAQKRTKMYNTCLELLSFCLLMLSFLLRVLMFFLFVCFFSANIEITRVRKSNDSEIAVMKAALKKEQTKSASLEMSLQQKVCLLCKQFRAFLMYERDWETVSKKAGAGSEWVARAQGWLSRGRLGSRQVSALRPSPPYAGGIWKRGFTLKTHRIFSVHTSKVEFENVTITGHFGFVWGNSVREPHCYHDVILFEKLRFKFFSVRNKTQRRLFSNSSGFKSVF